MRTIIDIPDRTIKKLDVLASQKCVSRAELVRQSVEEYLNKHCESANMALEDFAGFGKDYKGPYSHLDALEFEDVIRGKDKSRERDRPSIHDCKQEPFHS